MHMRHEPALLAVLVHDHELLERSLPAPALASLISWPGMEPAATVFYPHTWLATVLLKVSVAPASLVWLAPVCGSQWIKVPAAKEHALDRSKTLGAVLLLELRKPLLPLAVVRPWSNLFASVVLCNYCRFLCVLRCHEAHAIFVGLRDARRSGPGDRVLLRASEDNGRWRAGRAPWPDG